MAFISRKIRKMWKNKSGPEWKNSSKKVFKLKEDREKSSVICYKCNKPGHFKSERLELEKSKDKKSLMSTWEDLDDTTSDEEGEKEINLCLMVDTTSEELE